MLVVCCNRYPSVAAHALTAAAAAFTSTSSCIQSSFFLRGEFCGGESAVASSWSSAWLGLHILHMRWLE